MLNSPPMRLLLSLSVLSALSIYLFSAQAADRLTSEQKLWKRAGFAQPILTELAIADPETNDASPTITHTLDATIVMFRNSGWTQAQLESHLNRTNQIYAQCGIKLGKVTLVETNAYRNKLDLQSRWMEDTDDTQISEATPIETRPVIYLMRNLMPGNSQPEGAFTNIHSFWVELPQKSQNTIWISAIINRENYFNYQDIDESGHISIHRRDASYNVFAHEIAHLLADQGHETDLPQKNLLAGSPSEVNDHLLPRQCEKMKQSPLLKSVAN